MNNSLPEQARRQLLTLLANKEQTPEVQALALELIRKPMSAELLAEAIVFCSASHLGLHQTEKLAITQDLLLAWMLRIDVPTLTNASYAQYPVLLNRLRTEAGDMELFGAVMTLRSRRRRTATLKD